MVEDLPALARLRNEPHVSVSDFRQAMRRLVGAVTIVTSTDGRTPVGLTATAVTSLSAEPARILACVNLHGSSFRTIAESRRMAINVLSAEQADLAKVFGGLQDNPRERFHPAQWETLMTGAPILCEALAALDCVVDEMMVAHSHAVLIGEIKAAKVAAQSSMPLLYASGSFTTLQAPALNG